MRYLYKAAVFLAVCALFLCACRGDYSQRESAAPETIGAEQIMEMIRAAEESLRAAESTGKDTDTALPETTFAETTAPNSVTAESAADTSAYAETVYWTTSGEVWHQKADCSSLSQAKQRFSGTVDEAVLAGKARACKRCT